MTPINEIIGKIVSNYLNGSYEDRDQKRLAFYERLEFEAEAFEVWLKGENPFYCYERYSDEPIIYVDDETQDEWVAWLRYKGVALSDEYQ